MGPATRTVTRIGLLGSIDGVPAFHQKHKGAPTLNIAELINLSLPPHVRYDPDNMLPWAIIPNEMSGSQQVKYFDWICHTDLNGLADVGVPGPSGPVKVKLFGGSLDLKGKEKFFNQIVVGGYCGCSTCKIHFDQGPRGPIFSSARMMLPAGHPLRKKSIVFQGQPYQFRIIETRSQPALKTTQSVLMYAMLTRRMNVEHYLGQKGPPILRSLNHFNYQMFNVLEWMHNLARTFDNYLDLLVGRDANYDDRARSTCRHLNLFREVWETVYLSQVRTRILARLGDDNIDRGDPAWCRRWLRACAVTMPADTRVAVLRQRVTEFRDAAVRGERIPLPGRFNPLPWRLTPAAKVVVNRRVAEICSPHYTPVCSLGRDSFINKTGCWRTASKLIAFCCYLVPSLRGFVRPFRNGLRSLILGLRILEGQTFSVNEMKKLNVQLSPSVLKKSDIARAKTLIVEGLSMIEGSVPVCLLVPATHCLCHYPGDVTHRTGASAHGLLKLLWMIAFGKSCMFLNSCVSEVKSLHFL